MPFFDVYGPFEIAKNGGEVCRSQPDLWEAVEAREEGLSDAIGCYLFGTRYGDKITPWYIGMTVAEGGFFAETFQPHKTEIYTEIVESKSGKPVLFLFPLLTDEDRFSRARVSGKKVISWLERTLMGLAFGQNPEISNIRDMTFLRNVEVLGLLGPKRIGRPYKEAQAIRKVLLGRK